MWMYVDVCGCMWMYVDVYKLQLTYFCQFSILLQNLVVAKPNPVVCD